MLSIKYRLNRVDNFILYNIYFYILFSFAQKYIEVDQELAKCDFLESRD